FTTMVKVAIAPLATEVLENTTLPVLPTDGCWLMLQPVPVLMAADTKVVPVGTGLVTVTLAPPSGPLLMKLTVYVMLLPAATGSGASVTLLMARSARRCTVVVVLLVKTSMPPAAVTSPLLETVATDVGNGWLMVAWNFRWMVVPAEMVPMLVGKPRKSTPVWLP